MSSEEYSESPIKVEKCEENEKKEELRKAELEEEAKLRAKYPQAMRPGGSAFLQKRLHKGKYFDSGDYNMAKAKSQKARVPAAPIVRESTGDAIPTPDVLPTRKTSLVQSKLATELS
ncbi:cAMP-regulated phosphoprotein 19-like isoform X2 [Limulus polyphemus]|uniref:cAMP-regulated phosphoprotein 19-like isoform X2 n=1 Tax=Limulus polyphemus TaxID=6850 RepID=A0ABM1B4Y4_LIMPO|nr:cAMP-regulated phosphoprotein 19-like isoform X2 [Limulus polyphemus]